MTELIGLESIRATISTDLTRILALYGRLKACPNVRVLPSGIRSAQCLIDELQELEKRYYGFAEILRENIESRTAQEENSTSQVLHTHPNIKGLRLALYELAWPLVKSFCLKEKAFLEAAQSRVQQQGAWRSLLKRSVGNCDLLFAWCQPRDSILLLELKLWCEAEIIRNNSSCLNT